MIKTASTAVGAGSGTKILACCVVKKKTKQKSLQITEAGKGVGKREPSYTVGGNVGWCSHHGKQYGGSSENFRIELPYPVIHSWAYIQTKLIQTDAPLCLQQH